MKLNWRKQKKKQRRNCTTLYSWTAWCLILFRWFCSGHCSTCGRIVSSTFCAPSTRCRIFMSNWWLLSQPSNCILELIRAVHSSLSEVFAIFMCVQFQNKQMTNFPPQQKHKIITPPFDTWLTLQLFVVKEKIRRMNKMKTNGMSSSRTSIVQPLE